MICYLIPAYNPNESLPVTVGELLRDEECRVVVVNDGSLSAAMGLFNSCAIDPRVTILSHAINIGKGAALKTGLNHIFCQYPTCSCVVTLDADGQHMARDAVAVGRQLSETPESLVLGSRKFEKEVPFRSLAGNIITRYLFFLLVGKRLTDTQTGLRGIPVSLIPDLLRIETNGYDYELDMLLLCKHSGRRIEEVAITTIYQDGNKTSHFNPIIDSFKIYFVMMRFAFTSAITSVIDYAVFIIVGSLGGTLATCQIAGRAAALAANYFAVRRMVFYSKQSIRTTFPKYLLLVVVSGTVSYTIINTIHAKTSMPILASKAVAELLVFIVNFVIQRDLIFTDHKVSARQTDWDVYYEKPFWASKYTRNIMKDKMLQLVQRYAGNAVQRIAELGGANSFIAGPVIAALQPVRYCIIDNNEKGLSLARNLHVTPEVLELRHADILSLADGDYDLVISIGLVEHFDPVSTVKAIDAHFRQLKPGGIAIITFPTPTWLYRISRRISELFGIWAFPDERPLALLEVTGVAERYGAIVHKEILWQVVFTQGLVVVRKNLLQT